MYAQKELTDRILLDGNVKNTALLVPIIISESNYDKFDNKSIEITVSNVELNKQSQTEIKNTVMSNIDILQWQKETGISKEVQSEFSKILSSSNVPQRVKDMALKLFMANNYQTI